MTLGPRLAPQVHLPSALRLLVRVRLNRLRIQTKRGSFHGLAIRLEVPQMLPAASLATLTATPASLLAEAAASEQQARLHRLLQPW